MPIILAKAIVIFLSNPDLKAGATIYYKSILKTITRQIEHQSKFKGHELVTFNYGEFAIIKGLIQYTRSKVFTVGIQSEYSNFALNSVLTFDQYHYSRSRFNF